MVYRYAARQVLRYIIKFLFSKDPVCAGSFIFAPDLPKIFSLSLLTREELSCIISIVITIIVIKTLR